MQNLTPELKASMDELKEAAESLKRSYHVDKDEPPHTIHNPVVTDPEAIHDGVTPAEAATTASAPVATPQPTEPAPAVQSEPVVPTVAQATVVDQQIPAKQAIPEPVADKSSASQQPSGER